MSTFTCDVCGGKVVSSGKQDWFVCENCGSEYPVEWMKAKFQKGKKVQVEGIATIENLLVRAQQFFNQRKYSDAKEYCNKVFDIDANNIEARKIAASIDEITTNTKSIERQIRYADELIEVGRYQEAEKSILVALQSFPDNGRLQHVYNELQSWKNAKIDGQKLLRYDGDDVSFTIPNGITSICDHAFASEDNRPSPLKAVFFPSSLISIGESAFEGCEDLERVYWSLSYSGVTIGGYAFCGCKKLEKFDFPYGITYIGESAFEGCVSLKGNIELHNLGYLGNKAFYGCKELLKIDVYKSYNLGAENGYVGYCSLYTGGLTQIITNLPGYEKRKSIMSQEDYELEINNQRALEEKRKQSLQAFNRQKGVCQYCGGQFKGLFSRYCTNCGKTKDY